MYFEPGHILSGARIDYHTITFTFVQDFLLGLLATASKTTNLLKHSVISVFILINLLAAWQATAADNNYYLNNSINFDLSTTFDDHSCNNSSSPTFTNCKGQTSLFLALNETIDENETSSPESDFTNSYYFNPISTQPDWNGLKQDTNLFLFYQFFVIGILYVMPEDLSGWSDEVKDTWSVDTYKDNLSHIVWDADKWWINYILHPYWGGTYYVRARNRGYDEHASVWYSILLSTLYEFGSEALFERPSAQDLIITPLGGYFFGKYMMTMREKTKANAAARARLSFYDKTLLILTDPLGWINHSTSKLLGFAGKFSFQPVSTLPLPDKANTQAFNLQPNNTKTSKEFSSISLDMGLKLTLSW